MSLAQKLRQEGYKEGYQEGYQEGCQEALINIIIKLLEHEVDPKSIAIYTEVPLDKILEIQNKSKN